MQRKQSCCCSVTAFRSLFRRERPASAPPLIASAQAAALDNSQTAAAAAPEDSTGRPRPASPGAASTPVALPKPAPGATAPAAATAPCSPGAPPAGSESPSAPIWAATFPPAPSAHERTSSHTASVELGASAATGAVAAALPAPSAGLAAGPALSPDAAPADPAAAAAAGDAAPAPAAALDARAAGTTSAPSAASTATLAVPPAPPTGSVPRSAPGSASPAVGQGSGAGGTATLLPLEESQGQHQAATPAGGAGAAALQSSLSPDRRASPTGGLKTALGPASPAARAAGKAHGLSLVGAGRALGGDGSPLAGQPKAGPPGALQRPSKEVSIDRQTNGSIVINQDADSDSDDGKGPDRQQSSSPDSAGSQALAGQQPKLMPTRSGGLKTVKSTPAMVALNSNKLSPNARQAIKQHDKQRHAQHDEEMASRLDRFFEDPKAWRTVLQEVASAGGFQGPKLSAAARRGDMCQFRVRVPKPYPGLQYRRAKDLNAKCHNRFAENGTVVNGQLVDSAEWLKVDTGEFLPTRVGMINILEELRNEEDEKEGCAWCTGDDGSAQKANVEVVDHRGRPGQAR